MPVSSQRPIAAEVSLAALRHNYQVAKRAAPAARAFAVVKANAYGHGLARVAGALKDADGFATLELDGAIALREMGVSAPVLMLEGFFAADELALFDQYQLATVVHEPGQVERLSAARLKRPIDVFVKFNSGMNRLGFKPAAFRAAVARLALLPQVASLTLMTHFSSSDEPAGIEVPLARFAEAAKDLDFPRSLANSAATLVAPSTHAQWVRPGILLYGASPFADRSGLQLGLKPAMRLGSRIIAVQDLAPGDGIGYGLSFHAATPMRAGIVACGYADGYPRIARTGTPVAVDGVRTGTLGRVSMDMLAVDLTGIPQAGIGSVVELWGEQISIDAVAAGADTVGYELMCAVAPRVKVVEIA